MKSGRTETFLKANFLMGSEMDLVDTFGVKMVNITRVSGKKTNKMALEKWFCQMAASEMGNSKMENSSRTSTKMFLFRINNRRQ